ncbi:MAG: hypothetical protein MUO63_05660 [Desulfobulbaceae bacterium]|nr:hypothetical protein [Desulfobulbaceae bacterium]
MQADMTRSKPGDIFLLFHELPYDFSQDLPISVGPGVCVDMTPQVLLSSAEKGLSDYVLPGYSFSGTGINNCCLRCYSIFKLTESLTTENLLFLALLSMRLHNPLAIEIAGQFQVGDDDNPISDPKLYELSVPWAISGSYKPSDFMAAEKIVERLIEADKQGFSRLATALLFFSHVTLGQVSSYQLATLGLFTSLEALFVPNGIKANTISERIASFLANFEFPRGKIDEWVKNEYINARHKLAHGIHDATFGTKTRSDKQQKFGLLHEICRLSLLGFLSLDDAVVKKISEVNGPELQRTLKSLSPVAGSILNSYKFMAR